MFRENNPTQILQGIRASEIWNVCICWEGSLEQFMPFALQGFVAKLGQAILYPCTTAQQLDCILHVVATGRAMHVLLLRKDWWWSMRSLTGC